MPDGKYYKRKKKSRSIKAKNESWQDKYYFMYWSDGSDFRNRWSLGYFRENKLLMKETICGLISILRN